MFPHENRSCPFPLSEQGMSAEGIGKRFHVFEEDAI